ncbi:hypothetical protein D9M72_538920 [compost metagenome]
MRGQLRRVHNDPCAVFVSQRGQLADGEDFAGDVGGARNGQQADVTVPELGTQVLQGGPKRRGGHNTPVRDALPGEQVGVVFDVEVQHFADVAAVGHRQASGQQVQ